MHVTSVFDERRSVPYTLPQLDRPKSTRLQVYTFTYTPTDAWIVQSASYFPPSMSDTLSLLKIQNRHQVAAAYPLSSSLRPVFLTLANRL